MKVPITNVSNKHDTTQTLTPPIRKRAQPRAHSYLPHVIISNKHDTTQTRTPPIRESARSHVTSYLPHIMMYKCSNNQTLTPREVRSDTCQAYQTLIPPYRQSTTPPLSNVFSYLMTLISLQLIRHVPSAKM